MCAAQITAAALGQNVGAVLKNFGKKVQGIRPFLEQAWLWAHFPVFSGGCAAV